MKKSVKFVFALLVGALLLVSCSKKESASDIYNDAVDSASAAVEETLGLDGLADVFGEVKNEYDNAMGEVKEEYKKSMKEAKDEYDKALNEAKDELGVSGDVLNSITSGAVDEYLDTVSEGVDEYTNAVNSALDSLF